MRHAPTVLRALDSLLNIITRTGLVLVVPLSLLLFLQWPLRDALGRYSREANDCAQILFAFYVTLAITYATRHRTHLAADSVARRFAPATRVRLQRMASALVLIPWSSYLLYASASSITQSMMMFESFPETFNPGYWLIKLAFGVLAALVLLQAILDALTDSMHQ
jgi:TRAP-type mannitol/chloroaromatic compound transport system permease small subunit